MKGSFVKPQVFIIGDTNVDEEGMQGALAAMGVPEWETDAVADAEKLMEFAGKSCYLSFDTKLNKNLTKTGGRNNHDYLQKGIIGTKHGCYDGETEVLTNAGWKLFKNLVPSDTLATRTADGTLEYHSFSAYIEAPYEGKMYKVSGPGVSLLVTPNHNLLACSTTTKEGRKKNRYELVSAEVLGSTPHAYVKTANWHGTVDRDSLACWLLGFAIADGCLVGRTIHFNFGRNRQKAELLIGLSSKAGWELKERHYHNETRMSLKIPDDLLFSGMYAEDKHKDIPSLVWSLSHRGAYSMLQGMLDGDGSVDKGGCVVFDTTSPHIRAKFQQLCLHAGVCASEKHTLTEHDRVRGNSYGRKPLTRFTVHSDKFSKPEVNRYVGAKTRSEWIDWSGMVYCVAVPNNTLYVRRNGYAVWCGNSVLEHATINVFFFNVSRVFTHELVRHRAGTAFSQVSGRYVRVDKLDFFLPSCITEEPRAVEVFKRAIGQMEDNIAELEQIFGINEMKDFTKKKILTSAFRRIIGNGQANHICFTGNHRALRHEISVRTSFGAEEEIRLAFVDLFSKVIARYPAVYGDGKLVYQEGDSIPAVQFEHEKV